MLGNIFGSERSESDVDDDSNPDMQVFLRGPSETFEMSESGSIDGSPNRGDMPLNFSFDSQKLDEISQIFELHASGHFLSKDDWVKCMETIVPSMSIEDMEIIFDEYDQENKTLIHWRPIIEELRRVKVEPESNADAAVMDFFAGKLTADDFGTVDISAMAEHMTADPVVQALFQWFRDEGEPAIERCSELESTLENERADRAKVEKELRAQLEKALKKQDLVMRHCATLERDLEAQIEQHRLELQQQKHKSKHVEENIDQKERNRRDRYTRIIQEKDTELKKVRVEFLDLTKKHNALREELEQIIAEKIDAETNQRLAEDKHALMERRFEQLQEHSKNQLEASKEREHKLREQIKELSAYYARRSSIFMHHDSQEVDPAFVIQLKNDVSARHKISRQVWQTDSIDSIPRSVSNRSNQIQDTPLPRVISQLPATASEPELKITLEHSDDLDAAPRRAMSVQIDTQKLPKLDVKNQRHWEFAKQRRKSAANMLSLQSAYSHTLQNFRDQLGRPMTGSDSPDAGIRIEDEKQLEKYKDRLQKSQETVKSLKERLRVTVRDKESWEKQYHSLEQNFKENLGKISRGKQDNRIKRVMDSIYSDLNRRQDETILETLQTFQRELQLRNNVLTKLQHENAQLRGSQAGDPTSFNVKLWSDQIKEMQEKLIYAESQNIKASTDYRILKEEKENLLIQLKESHYQNDLLQKQLVETKTRQPVYNSSLIPFHHHSHASPKRERFKEDSSKPHSTSFSERTVPDEFFSKRTPDRPRTHSRILPRPGYFLHRVSWTELEEDFQHEYSTPLTPFDEPPPPPIPS